MKLTFVKKSGKKSLVIVPVFGKEKPSERRFANLLKSLATSKEFSGKAGESYFIYSLHVVFVGFGPSKKLTNEKILSGFAVAAKGAHTHRAKSVSVLFADCLASFAEHVGRAFVLGSYQPSAPYKTGAAKKKLAEARLSSLEVVAKNPSRELRAAVQKGIAIADATNEVRDWVNAPPNFANAAFFDEKAKEAAKISGARLTILHKKELEKLNMGALLGVNRGSPDEARLVILDYTPKGADPKKKPIVFVGKGILFDSGGYNLKPRGHIEDMQLDKAGASAVLALFKLLPILNVQQRIISVAPFTENLIGKHALKPSEILTTYSGKTVEITNTDAEGRLVLCDAIAYAIDTYKPEFLVDIATLTGACMVALGDRYAGLFGNNAPLMKKLRRAGKDTDELLWPLPIHKDFAAKMKGVYADLRNAEPDRDAGASKGAAFLKEFVGKTPWAHLDIAGPAFTNEPKKYQHKGATGFGLQLLARFVEYYANRD